MENLDRVIRQEKNASKLERNKISPFRDDMTLFVENPTSVRTNK